VLLVFGLGSGINAYFNVSMYCIGVFVCVVGFCFACAN